MESIGIIHFWTFLTAGILLNMTPGTDTIYILGRSMAHGTRAGVVSALGISTGSLVHTLAASTGLSLVLATSATAFTVMKFCGALYLIYLGIQAFRTTGSKKVSREKENKGAGHRQLYISGIVTNVLNPKVALFFLAFLPQFIDPASSNVMLSFLLLGTAFIVTGTCWNLMLAVYSAKFSRLLQKRGSTGNLMGRITGCLFIGLGVKLALMER